MNARPIDESPWLIESDIDLQQDIGNPNSPLEQHIRTRREKFLEGIIVNKKVWVKDFPMFVKGMYQANDKCKVSTDMPTMLFKRCTRILERNPRMFQTLSDVLRFLIVAGLDICEEIWMGDKETLKLNKYYKMMDLAFDLAEQASVTRQIHEIMRKIHENYLTRAIDKTEYLRQLDILEDSSGDFPAVKQSIEDAKVTFLDESGLKREREKMQNRLRVQRFRDKNKGGLHLVEREKENG